jgi:hypothetical protein
LLLCELRDAGCKSVLGLLQSQDVGHQVIDQIDGLLGSKAGGDDVVAEGFVGAGEVGSEQGDFLGVAAAVEVLEGFVCLGHFGGCAERLDRPHPGPLPQARGRE